MFRDLFLDSWVFFLVKLVPGSRFSNFLRLFFLFCPNLIKVHEDKKVQETRGTEWN